MLAFRENTVWFEWTGQPRPLNGKGSYQLARNVETLYSDAELATYGLYRVTPMAVPPGYELVNSHVENGPGGVPVQSGTLEAPPAETPADYPLTARQLRLGLIRNSIPLSTVRNAINAIPNSAQRDEAQVYWEFSTLIYWDHPMTQALMGMVGITSEQAAAMWMIAKDYEA